MTGSKNKQGSKTHHPANNQLVSILAIIPSTEKNSVLLFLLRHASLMHYK